MHNDILLSCSEYLLRVILSEHKLCSRSKIDLTKICSDGCFWIGYIEEMYIFAL